MTRILNLAMALSLSLASLPALAAGGPDNSQPPAVADAAAAYEDRAGFMKQVGARMKTINLFSKGQSGTAADAAKAGAELAELAKATASHFGQSDIVGDSEAKPEIWQNWADYATKIAAFQDASANLAKATAGSDLAAITAAFKATGMTCKSCHESYRK